MTSMRMLRATMISALLAIASIGHAQQLTTKFACSQERVDDNQRALYADSGEIRIDGNRIDAFHWESSLFRRTHGFECSIDESDGLQADVRGEGTNSRWRISLQNAREARNRRGYDSSHGFNCAIRLERDGDTLHIKPTCPALCGSRSNFSELSVELSTGKCRYEE